MKPLNRLYLSLFVAVAVAQPAFAGAGHKAHFGGGKAFREALKSLNLSAEQKEKIASIRKSGKEANKEARAALMDARKKGDELLKSDAKKEELVAHFESTQTLRNKLAKARFEMMLAVRDVLTPEQRQKFRAFLESHKGIRPDKSDRDEKDQD
jgi:periplasmic protein CpxP/Spy